MVGFKDWAALRRLKFAPFDRRCKTPACSVNRSSVALDRIVWFVHQSRAEFFNILNHPNFGPSTNGLPSALFGRSTQTLAHALGSGSASGGFNPLYQIGGPRSIQLALKLQF